jgi:hypothetical protein
VTIASVGCGFMIFPAFAGFRLVLRPELQALGVGTLRMAQAAPLARSSPASGRPVLTEANEPVPPGSQIALLQLFDPATLAVFTPACVLGRRVA